MDDILIFLFDLLLAAFCLWFVVEMFKSIIV